MFFLNKCFNCENCDFNQQRKMSQQNIGSFERWLTNKNHVFNKGPDQQIVREDDFDPWNIESLKGIRLWYQKSSGELSAPMFFNLGTFFLHSSLQIQHGLVQNHTEVVIYWHILTHDKPQIQLHTVFLKDIINIYIYQPTKTVFLGVTSSLPLKK